jgi:hypothetical protein
MFGGAHTQAALDVVIEVPNCDAGHDNLRAATQM